MPVGYSPSAVNRQQVGLLSTPGVMAGKGGPGGNYAAPAIASAPGSMPGVAPPRPGQSSYSYPSSWAPPQALGAGGNPYSQNPGQQPSSLSAQNPFAQSGGSPDLNMISRLLKQQG